MRFCETSASEKWRVRLQKKVKGTALYWISFHGTRTTFYALANRSPGRRSRPCVD